MLRVSLMNLEYCMLWDNQHTNSTVCLHLTTWVYVLILQMRAPFVGDVSRHVTEKNYEIDGKLIFIRALNLYL